MNWKADLRRIRASLQRNVLLKVFSVLFAVGLWAFVNLGARDAEKALLVPVELRNIPPDLVVTSAVTDVLDVRIRGPRTILGTIDERRIRASLDLGRVRPGQTSFKIDPEMLGLPRGVRVTRLSPVELTLEVERLLTRTVPVVLSPEAVVPEGFRLSNPQIEPRRVSIVGPESDLRQLGTLSTAPVAFPPVADMFEELVAVERLSPLVRITPRQVIVRARLVEVIGTRSYAKVDVGIENAAGVARVAPAKVDVTVRGPERILAEFKPSGANVYVDAGELEPGTHQREVRTQLPEGLEATRIEPGNVTVEIDGRDGTAR